MYLFTLQSRFKKKSNPNKFVKEANITQTEVEDTVVCSIIADTAENAIKKAKTAYEGADYIVKSFKEIRP